MSLSRNEQDDVTHKLAEIHEFYNRKPTPGNAKIWLAALGEQTAAHILRAFDDHVKHGKYFPQPADILEIIGGYKARERAATPQPEQPKRSSPEVSQAWITYIRLAHGFELPAHRSVPNMPNGQALEIVNRQARKHDRLDAIKPEHRIAPNFATATETEPLEPSPNALETQWT